MYRVFKVVLLLLLLAILVATMTVLLINITKKQKTGKASHEELTVEIDYTGIPVFYLDEADDVKIAADVYNASWRIHFFDVGQGDAILLQGNRKNILIDGGDKDSGIVKYLQDLAIDTLHWVIATHPHADHIAGLLPVLRSFPIIHFMDTGVSHTSAIYRNYRSLIDSTAVSYTRGFVGWEHSFAGDFKMKVLHPDTINTYGINDASLVVRMEMGETYALFTGDAEHKAERAILQRGEDLKSHIFKVGHHGSKTSSSKAFIDAVKPDLAFLFCGQMNKYGFPHDEALAVLHQSNAKLYQTDLHGSILVLIDESGYTVFPERKTGIHYAEFTQSNRIDVNTAEIQLLTTIIHIGEVTARLIIENRPYSTLDDLRKVRGIGQKKLEDIKREGKAFAGL